MRHKFGAEQQIIFHRPQLSTEQTLASPRALRHLTIMAQTPVRKPRKTPPMTLADTRLFLEALARAHPDAKSDLTYTDNFSLLCAVEDKLVRRIPADLLRDSHHWLILHGRYVCKARTPECWRCVAAQWCRFPDKSPPPSSSRAKRGNPGAETSDP